MARMNAFRLALLVLLLSWAFPTPAYPEILWSDNFSDGNFSADPAWNVPWGEVSVVPFGGSQALDCHAQPMGFSGRIYVGLPDVGFGGTDVFSLEFDVHPRETLTSANNVRIQIWNWETYDCFELMENDNDNLQLRSNGTTVAQVALNGFPNRWHHVLMARASSGFWTVIWDVGGSNQTIIQGQDPWGGPTSTLLPVLQIQCDGNYNAVNGAFFDNLEMWSGGLLVWHDDFEDGNYTADPAWNIPWGLVSVPQFAGDYVLDCYASPEPPGFSGRIYVSLPDIGYGGLDAFKLECDVHPRKTLSSANNVRIQIWNWETYDYFELMENDNDNLQLRSNGQILAQEPLNGFPDRWHHVVMQTDSAGFWTVIWDQGGSNQTTLTAQGPWGSAQNTLVPVLQIQCDGYYSTVNGAYFDNFVMSTLEGSYPGEFIVDDHTAALWHFNENFGLVAHDATSNNYDMTLQDGAGWHSPGWNNTPSAVDLTDPDAKVNSDYTLGNGWDAITLEAWIYPTQIGPFTGWFCDHPIITRQEFHNVSDCSYFLYLTAKGEIYAGVNLNEPGGPVSQALTDSGLVQVNNWYHVAATWSNGEPLRIFLNDMSNPVEISSDPVVPGFIRTGMDALRIGCNWVVEYYNEWEYFQGYIDEARISDIDRYPVQPGQICLEEHWTDGNWTSNPTWFEYQNQGNCFEIASLGHEAPPCLAGWENSQMTDYTALYTPVNCGEAITADFWIHKRTPTFSRIDLGFSSGPYNSTNQGFRVIVNQNNMTGNWEFIIIDVNGVTLSSQVIQYDDDRWTNIHASRTAEGNWEIFWDFNGPYQTVAHVNDSFASFSDIYLWLSPQGYYSVSGGFYIDDIVISSPEPPGGSVQITLTPITPPIIIPESGGSFSYNATLENFSGALQIFDVWCTVQVPGGSQFTVLGPVSLTLNSGASLTRLRTQGVPASAPGGEYAYWAFVGDYPWNVTSSDHFPFVKQGGGGDWMGEDGWICGGESFPGEMASEGQAIPEDFAVIGVSPNPFNPVTTIRFALPEAAKVDLTIYDVGGRAVSRVLNAWREAGVHEVAFDGSNLSSGVYLYHLEADRFSASGKLVLMK